MHRTFGYLSKRLVQVRPGEGAKVGLTFAYFFLVITAYYVVKPVSRSLILDDLGSRVVPYVDLLSAILMGPVVTLFARLVDRTTKPRLVTGAFVGAAALMVGFWLLLHRPEPWIAGAFYVWISIFSVLVVTLFWLVANDLYRPRDAKRLFGFIGSGGILGGLVGSAIAAVGAQVFGTDQLLFCSAALLLGAWLVVQSLWRWAPAAGEPAPSGQRHETFFADLRGFAQLLTRSRYLLLLVALVGLNKLAGTLVYYQFNPFIEATFPTADAKTTFTGLFLGAINVLAFLVQFFLTSWILRRRGLRWALLALPLVLLGGSAALLVLPLFWIAASMELCDRSLDYSVQSTAKEILYLPIDRTIRYKVKPFIDMVVFRFGKGIAAVIGIVLLDWMRAPASTLSLLVLPIVGVWLIVVFQIRREYETTIRTMLQARAAQRASREPATARSAGGLDGLFGPLTGARASERKLALAAQLVSPPGNGALIRELLAGLEAYEEDGATSLLDARFQLAQLRTTIQRRDVSPVVRRQAVRLLVRQSDQDTLDYLCGMLLVEDDEVVRDEVIRQLVRLRLGMPGLSFPLALIRRQIGREVQSYQRMVQVCAIYRQHGRARISQDDPVLALLRVLSEESVEHIFRLLMLVYRPEDIHLIYEQLRADERYVRTDALELLDTLVDYEMRVTLLLLLDEDRFLGALSESGATPQEPTLAYRFLQQAIWDHHCWLSVTTLCAVGRLQLTTMRQELEKAMRHPQPLVASAAKVALALAVTA